MTPELDRWLWAQRWQPPKTLRGRWVSVERRPGLVMYKTAYNVYSTPQGGFVQGTTLWIGKIEWRNAWGAWAFYPDSDVMFNKEILAEIQSGEFAKEFILENQANAPTMKAMRRMAASHSVEVVGARLRDMMPWIKKNRLVDQSKN